MKSCDFYSGPVKSRMLSMCGLKMPLIILSDHPLRTYAFHNILHSSSQSFLSITIFLPCHTFFQSSSPAFFGGIRIAIITGDAQLPLPQIAASPVPSPSKPNSFNFCCLTLSLLPSFALLSLSNFLTSSTSPLSYPGGRSSSLSKSISPNNSTFSPRTRKTPREISAKRPGCESTSSVKVGGMKMRSMVDWRTRFAKDVLVYYCDEERMNAPN